MGFFGAYSESVHECVCDAVTREVGTRIDLGKDREDWCGAGESWWCEVRLKITCYDGGMTLFGVNRDHDRFSVLTDRRTFAEHAVCFGILSGARYKGLCRSAESRGDR